MTTGATDPRRSVDGLSAQAHDCLSLDPLSGYVCLFRNRRGDGLKNCCGAMVVSGFSTNAGSKARLRGRRPATGTPWRCGHGISGCCCQASISGTRAADAGMSVRRSTDPLATIDAGREAGVSLSIRCGPSHRRNGVISTVRKSLPIPVACFLGSTRGRGELLFFHGVRASRTNIIARPSASRLPFTECNH